MINKRNVHIKKTCREYMNIVWFFGQMTKPPGAGRSTQFYRNAAAITHII